MSEFVDETIEIREPVQPRSVIEDLYPLHPWILPWTIHVSSGYRQVVSDLLYRIEEVMHSPTPALSYFRVSEELVYCPEVSVSYLYQRKLKIFFQAKQPLAARDKALQYIANITVTASTRVCLYCGGDLVLKDLFSESERINYPFLPQVKKDHRLDRSAHICLACAEQVWIESQKSPFALFANEDAEFPVLGDDDTFLTCSEDNTVESTEDVEARTLLEKEILAAAAAAMDLDITVAVEQPEQQDNEPKPNQVAVFSVDEVDKLEYDYKDATKEHSSRVKSLVKKLRATSATKDLMLTPEEWRNFCDDLEQRFPNFVEVIGFLRTQMALSAASDGVLRLPPFLLLGDPGIGKTEFALSIASAFKTKLEIIDIASAQCGATLTGSESHWSTSQTGAIFNSLVYSDHANCIIMLDELDKARQDEHFNTLAVLHQVLEPRQAKMYRDLSVPELTIDASHLIWIATGNKAELIEKPILDRFVCFHVEPPSKAQMPAIVANQYERFIETHPSGAVFDKSMRDDVMEELCKHHPRKVRKILNQAFGLAAIAERKHLTVEDIRACEQGDKKKNGIGFAAEIN